MSFYDTHLGMDFETDGIDAAYGLQPWRIKQGTAWATSLVWLKAGDEPQGCIRPIRDDMERMLSYALENNFTIVGWNLVFDIQILLAYDLEKLVMKTKWLDAMLIYKHATVEPEYESKSRPGKRKSYSLKTFVPEHFPDYAGYEADITYHNPTDKQMIQLHEYNIMDVVFTLKGAKMYWERLTPKQQNCAFIEAQCLPLVASTNLRGMLVDSLHLRHLRATLVAEAEEALAQLEPHGVTEQVIRSPKQLRELMFGQWGLTPIKKTGTGEDSTDKESLHEIAISSGDPRVKLLRSYRECLNAIGKFVDSPLEAAKYNGDGYARPQFIVNSTYTGRFTCSSKQKILKGKKVKGEELEE